MKHIILILVVILAVGARAATFTAATCSVADVTTAIGLASNGDTVVIPNGSCSWASGIATSKQITLNGASLGGVIITDTAGAAILLDITIGSSFHTIVGQLNFLPGSGTGSYMRFGGTGLVPLMYGMDFNIPNFQLQNAIQWDVTGGVIWNTTFESTTNLGGSCGQQIGSDSGSIVVKPNINWDAADTQGLLDDGTHNLYIEDSTFSYVGQAPDVDDNGRVAIRHTQFTNFSGGLTHGTTSTYGGRSVELYDNTFTYNNTNRNVNRYFWMRAGTLVATRNHFDKQTGGCYGLKNTLTFAVENAARADGGHGCCTGYMCFHMTGSGTDSTGTGGHSNLSAGQSPADQFQLSEPVYVWNNTGAGQGSAFYGFNDGAPRQCNATNPGTGNPWTTTDLFIAGRDYFFDDSGTSAGAKPGWTSYTYPHPLRSLVSGSPSTSYSPNPIPDYGSVTVNTTSAPQTTTLTNNGTSNLVTTGITLTGTNFGDFAISGGTCNPAGQTIAASASCTVAVTFTPASAGARSANVHFVSNAPSSPDDIGLSGTGASNAPQPSGLSPRWFAQARTFGKSGGL